MSRASNSLKTTDVLTTPIKLKYSASYDYSSFATHSIQVLKGINGPVTITGSIPQVTLNYRSIQHLYYSNYLTGSYPVSASNADNFLQSTAASGSDDADVRYFPTESGAEITIFSIPTEIFGQQISRRSFILSSSAYCIVDDGNGNLLDISTGSLLYIVSGYFDAENYFESASGSFSVHVGNVIYPQGIAIITAPSYQAYFIGCKRYEITYVPGGGDLYFDYTNCSGTLVSVGPIAAGSQTFCAESGSVNVLSGNYTLADLGYCQ